MATKTQYTKEFREKVVEEYRKGNLTLEEVADKYGIPAELLQDWINKDDFENIFVTYINHSVDEKTSIWSKIHANVGLAYQKIKANGWLLAGCIPFLIPFFIFITCNKQILQSETNDTNITSYFLENFDSLVILNSELNKKIRILNIQLDKIDKKLNFNLSPSTSIVYDYRRWNRYRRTNIKNVKNDNSTNTSINNVINNDSSTIVTPDTIAPIPGHGRGCCCCQCKRDSLK